jgi:hypothetical protein
VDDHRDVTSAHLHLAALEPWLPTGMKWAASMLAGKVSSVLGVGPSRVALTEVFPDAAVSVAEPDPTDWSHLPRVDLVWADRALGRAGDRASVLEALRVRLNPGGVLAVVEGGLSIRFLPDGCGLGTPGLLARLDATLADRFDGFADQPALDWPMQLRAAGLTPTGSRTFLVDLPAPVSRDVRLALIRRVGAIREQVGDWLTRADTTALDRLLDTDDTLGLARRPDLFVLSAHTVHTARV